MNIALWALQIILALIILGAGVTKLKDDRLTYARTRPPNTSYAEDLGDGLYRTIGVAEVLAAIGLVLPWATGIAPWLTPLAAAGIVVLMAGAIVTHARRGERHPIAINVVLLVTALAVALGRWLG
jgi:hypothetical protein